MVRHTPSGAQREGLRQAVRLTALSMVFVTLGVAMTASGELLLGSVVTLLFSSSLIVGILRWRAVRHGRPLPRTDGSSVWIAVAAILMAVASLGVFFVAWTAWDILPPGTRRRYARELVLVVGAVGTVFFSAGGVLSLIRRLRRRTAQGTGDDQR
ncbi:hypothetical protein [Leucobacter sp. wl10]|uniref:hypothetical protein n=1 Tax=Leucobacter sp. wl10 TaxID=2304677 RepID=UPI000E5A106A|nr:hypothetical protein [Leucobacter sp. wl10]RGE19618.1 hypothetical protein D1J51_11225 [Leucobacter sp. wl10]